MCDPKDQSKQLPIYRHKAKLVAAVKASSFLLVTGETGSGKTTQLPQFLYEAGKLPYKRPPEETLCAFMETVCSIMQFLQVQ